MSLLVLAEQIATKAHAGQFRWDNKTEYITHPRSVRELVAGDLNAEIVSWLHDTVEDTDITLEYLEKHFPFEIVTAVDAMTKRPGEMYLDYILRVKQNKIATKVKIADITHNLEGLKPTSSMASKYHLAIYILQN